MRFSPSFLDEIRARLPVSDVVGRKVAWDRRKSVPAKGDYWACCPFHSEKTPSFHADDRKGRYYCFGCNVSGDVFTFLVENEGLSFPEAVERLAGEAGIAMPKTSAEDVRRDRRRRELGEVMELAARFFEDRLQSAEGAAARGYLADRGLTTAIQQQFRIGYAPDDRRALKTCLAGSGVTPEQMIEAGLVIAGEEIAVPYDRFRNRVMFPIAGARGGIIAFGGRALDDKARAKYLNSPDTALFHKRDVLYNFANARKSAHDTGTLIAVEGYMDVIAVASAGFDNVVAPLGTALTPAQLELMWRLAPEPVLCFDGDKAGRAAAFRAADMALAVLRPGYSLRFVALPQGEDPDDLIRAHGTAAFETALAAARPLADIVWEKEVEGADWSTPERRALLDKRVGEILRAIADETVRHHYKAHLRERLNRFAATGNTRERSFRGRAPGHRAARWRRDAGFDRRHEARPAAATEALKSSALVRGSGDVPQREALLVLAVINHPALLEQHAETFAAIEFTAPVLDRLRQEIIDIAARCEPLETGALTDQLEELGLKEDIERLKRRLTHKADWFVDPSAAPRDAETAWLHTLSLHGKSLTLRRELHAAELALSREGTEDNVQRLRALNAELATSDGTEALIEGFGEASNRAGGHDR